MTGSEEPHADKSRTEGDECFVDGSIGVGPQPELAEAMQPGIRTFHDPAINPQATPMFRPTLGNLGIDPSIPQFLPVGLRIVGPVRIQFFGLGGLVSFRPGKVGDAVDQGQQLCHIGGVGSCHGDRQGNTMGIGQHMMLCP